MRNILVVLFIIFIISDALDAAHKCKYFYANYMIKFMYAHKSPNNTVVIDHMITKLSQATGETKLYLANCLGALNDKNKNKFT